MVLNCNTCECPAPFTGDKESFMFAALQQLCDIATNINPVAQIGSDFYLSVAKGLVPGHSSIEKFGQNPEIDSGSGFEHIWDASILYVPPTEARIHDVASSSAQDAGTVLSSGNATGGSLTSLVDTGATFATDTVAVGDVVLNDTNVQIGVVSALIGETELTIAGRMRSPSHDLDGDAIAPGDAYRVVTNAGTGASLIQIRGLDELFLEQEEFVVLNGLGVVATIKSWVRQYRAHIFGPGTTGAVGTVTSTAQVDGTITCQIIDGNNQTLMAIYTVPADKTGYLHKWWGSMSRKITAISTMELRIGQLAGIGYLHQTRSLDTSATSDFIYAPVAPLVIPGGGDIWVEADSDTNDVSVSAGFGLILVDNE